MLNSCSDVDGFSVNKTTQEICNSQYKNETNVTNTFTIQHDKFLPAIVFHSKHDVHKLIGEQTMC